MKITLVRHLKVDHRYENSYDSEGFTEAAKRYDTSGIISSEEIKPRKFTGPVYVSDLKRTHLTLEKMFITDSFTETPLIREVPLKAFRKSLKRYPKIYWQIIGRLSWFFNIKNQDEVIRDTEKRAEKFLNMIEEKHKGEHVLVVTHGLFMMVMSSVLKKQGYHGQRILKLPKNGQEFLYSRD